MGKTILILGGIIVFVVFLPFFFIMVFLYAWGRIDSGFSNRKDIIKRDDK